jgi:phosphatidylserine/phosphatidylglycerophosphate/cardiolipin synthase-like enzyme
MVHFGGPDLPRGRLRDLLEERIESVPRGGAIDWVTYYFRDRRLAAALLAARARGVAVRVAVEGRARTAHANDAAFAVLRGLGVGFRRIVHPKLALPGVGGVRARLHEKLYCFSHPRPTAFVGSFNPSGDGENDDPEILDAIRDQDAGHNLLFEIREPGLVAGLVDHARRVHARRHGFLERFSPCLRRPLRAEGLDIHFSPRASANPIFGLLRGLGRDAVVRIAASHVNGWTMPREIGKLAKRVAAVELLVEETRRRVPDEVFRRLERAGASIRRVVDPRGYPMHAKFALVETRRERYAIFGSFNWTERSLRLNHEVCAISRDADTFRSFGERWEVLRGG